MSPFFFHRITLALLLALPLAACHRDDEAAHAKGDGHEHEDATEAEEAPRGAHRGRLLQDGAFAIELAVFEDGVPPEFHAWATQDGKPLAPTDVKLEVTLSRLDGETNRFAFAPAGEFLRADGVVAEPHSFSVTVTAQHAGATHEWRYDSFEGRVTIAAASAQAAGLGVAIAGPRLIRDVLPLYGRIAADPEAVREVSARFPGLVKSVAKSLGDPVKAGEVLARIESNDSLQVYGVTAPITGTITARAVQPGENAGAAPLFTISDLSRGGAELSVFPRDLSRLRVGQEVRLRTVEGERSTTGRIARLAPSGSDANQALRAWVRFDAPDASWTPGLHVQAEVLTGGAEVALAVKRSALQAFRDFTVVFVKVGDTYEVRMLELGRSDGEYVEVLSGLKLGAEYVAENSYLVKADIEKSGASHDH